MKQKIILTPRQKTVLQYLANGLTQKEIAVLMNLAAATIKNHIQKAKRKLHAQTSAHAVAIAITLKEVNVDIIY